jgi:hypothetical protein
VKQFQLDGDWLMYDQVPKSRECLLQLIDAVFENRKKTADHPETPILVHCIGKSILRSFPVKDMSSMVTLSKILLSAKKASGIYTQPHLSA